MATLPPSPFSFALVGAGRVGTAVAELLRRAGHKPVGIWSRSAASATRAADLLGGPIVELSELPPAEVVLLGVSDAAIGSTAVELGGHIASATVVVHFAGSLGPEVLAPAAARSAALHPVQACPDVTTAIARLPGSAWGITTESGVEEWAIDVVKRDLHGDPVPVEAADRALWHAAAVLASNGAAAMLALGESVLGTIGIDNPEQVLGPLVRGTISNALEGGGGGATLTGPVVRGERSTVERHLSALKQRDASLVSPFLAGTRAILAAARASDRIDDAAVDEWTGFLGDERWS